MRKILFFFLAVFISLFRLNTFNLNPVASVAITLESLDVKEAYLESEPIPEPDIWKPMTVVATAYTAGCESTGKNPGHPAYGVTKTGTVVEEGRTIAVDPKVIPLGSKVYIPTFDRVYIAEDTGRLIKGNKIDIYIEDLDRALEWGIRKVKIYVLEQK